MGTCCSSAVEEAGSEIGASLLEKGKSMAGQTGSKILQRVETTFDDKVDKIINEKLLEKCDTTFNKAIDTFVEQAFSVAMKKFGTKDDAKSGVDWKEANIAEKMKRKKERHERLEKAREQLRDYRLPQLLIDTMEQAREILMFR
eukprot:232933_1